MTLSPIPYADHQDKPNVARMYDYYLGGHHNFAIDRQTAERALAIYPELRQVMWANRAFLRRAVTFLAAQGVDQFLDIGSGLPTAGNVHEIAQAANPAARVAYVDSDGVAVILSERLLADNPTATVLRADARHPEGILGHEAIRGLLDFGRPVAVLLVALLHFVTDDAASDHIVRTLRGALAPGSYLVISHATSDNMPPDVRERMAALYSRTSNPVTTRSLEQIARFFTGFELVEPGLVYAPLWRPDPEDELFRDRPEHSVTSVGVGRKP